ncbi:hypothetical protein [Methanohalobium sp.]|uniref:hypothetical protein n=1 Tax=Methanohalobium sp. TaxID=2837493 RepID=UPI0025F75194|nr:hypothetical protein [Methanohalobium sp.]
MQLSYASDGSLLTDEREVNASTLWDTQSDWEAYQSKNNINITNGNLELSQVASKTVISTTMPFYLPLRNLINSSYIETWVRDSPDDPSIYFSDTGESWTLYNNPHHTSQDGYYSCAYDHGLLQIAAIYPYDGTSVGFYVYDTNRDSGINAYESTTIPTDYDSIVYTYPLIVDSVDASYWLLAFPSTGKIKGTLYDLIEIYLYESGSLSKVHTYGPTNERNYIVDDSKMFTYHDGYSLVDELVFYGTRDGSPAWGSIDKAGGYGSWRDLPGGRALAGGLTIVQSADDVPVIAHIDEYGDIYRNDYGTFYNIGTFTNQSLPTDTKIVSQWLNDKSGFVIFWLFDDGNGYNIYMQIQDHPNQMVSDGYTTFKSTSYSDMQITGPYMSPYADRFQFMEWNSNSELIYHEVPR